MLRTQNRQGSLWESIIPVEVLGLSGELAVVDRLLDDAAFWEPFRPHFSERWGRPSVPIDTFVRMMFLKFRYRLGYERLCVEVADSISWQMFCRIPLGSGVPCSTALSKIVRRVGEGTVRQLNDVLLVRAAGTGMVDLGQVRADTTVVEANVSYPTDSGLLAKGVRRIGRLVRAVKACGGAKHTRFRDRTRSALRRARAVVANLKRRSDDAKDVVRRLNLELAKIAESTLADAEVVLRNGRRRFRGNTEGRLGRHLADLAKLIDATAAVAAQTRERLAGQTPDGASRVVSLHDTDARPIVKGRLGKPVEFGYKVQVVDNRAGLVLDYSVHEGNPPDAPLLAPAIARIKGLFGRVPRRVTADRGYSDQAVEADLGVLGVAKTAIPKPGKPSAQRRALERTDWFHRLVVWRTGSEARISRLKNGYGMDRTLLDGTDGCATWCGWAILAHNTVTIAALADPTVTIRHRRSRRNRQRPPDPTATGPPHANDIAT